MKSKLVLVAGLFTSTCALISGCEKLQDGESAASTFNSKTDCEPEHLAKLTKEDREEIASLCLRQGQFERSKPSVW